jgi:phosphomannomutase
LTLIKSISGIRGTIGGKPGDSLSPNDIVKYTAAYATWLLKSDKTESRKVVIGRDARPSGLMVSNIVSGTLMSMGLDVIDLELSTTPTVEIAVADEKAAGGIIITASHNTKQWNALKLLNYKGEFISEADGNEILMIAESDDFNYVGVNKLGGYKTDNSYIQKHIDKILALPLVDVKAIKAKNFKIVIDCVNSTGGIAVPMLLEALGVDDIIELFCEVTGDFSHNPEPLPQNITELCKIVTKRNAHFGIAVDPDVDRLALVSEDGEPFGEEYTLVAVADYVLKHKHGGNTVSNLSSTRALNDITLKHGGNYFASAVGEVNVVEMMKKNNAVIGGEGNGGVIYPELHYGRDALVGIALFLTHLAKYGKSCSMLRANYPSYHISKNKIELSNGMDVDNILLEIQEKYKKQPINTIDGVKIEFDKEWVHLRKSNTEPIIRIYAESSFQTTADNLAEKIISDIKDIILNKV